MRTIITFLAASALLVTSSFAAPIEAADAAAAPASNEPAATNVQPDSSSSVQANYGTPVCKSRAFYDICTASNANAYCDGTGFHCDFHATCKGNCRCES